MRAPDLIRALAARSQRYGDRLAFAFVDGGGSVCAELTFAGLDRAARAVADQLRERGLGVGDRALLLYAPGLDYVAAFFGCLSAGVIAVPAYPPLGRRADRVASMLADATPAAVLTAAAAAPAVGELVAGLGHGNVEVVPTEGTGGPAEPGPHRLPEPSDVAFLQYTSGSTATPRGVEISHANLVHNQRMIREAFAAGEDTVAVSWLPLYHDMGLIGGVLQPVAVGATCYLLSPLDFLRDPGLWLRTISRVGATVSGGPNFAYDLCVRRVAADQREALDLSSWTVAFNGAEPVRAATLERFAEAFGPAGFRRRAFHPCYGLAEATLLVTARDPGLDPVARTFDAAALSSGRAVESPAGRPLVSCGHPWLGQEVLVVDQATHRVLASGEVGEIWVGGESVARGYWGRGGAAATPGGTAPEGQGERSSTFGGRLAGGRAGYLRTGDLGFLLDGELYVTGRARDLVIVRGQNHYPQDIELTAEQAHPLVRPGCVAAFAVDGEDGEQLVVVAEVREPSAAGDVVAPVTEAVVAEHGLRPGAVVLLAKGELPKTSSGKLRRQECRRQYLAGAFTPLPPVGRASGPAEQGPLRAGPALDAWRAVEPGPPGAGPALEALRAVVAGLRGTAAGDVATDRRLASLGLDSLEVMECLGILRARHGFDLPLELAFSDLTLAELAARAVGVDAGPLGEAAQGPPDAAELPLSSAQERIWLAQQLAGAASAYHVPVTVRIRGPLDAGALEAALQRLADRHEMLRTRITVVDGEPRQVVEPRVVVRLRRAAGHDARDRAVAAPIDLASAPLWRALLAEVAEGEHELVLVFHHVAVDGWSVGTLLRELARAYADPGAPAAPPARQYRDFVAWERSCRERVEGELEHWRRALRPPLPVLALPPRARPGAAGAALSASVTLAAELSGRLDRFAGEAGATRHMVLLAVYCGLLARRCRQEELVVGVPAVTRPDPSFERMIGLCLNTLPLRVDLSGQPSLEILVDRVRATVSGALAHRRVPFERIIDAVEVPREPGRTPLFQAFFNPVAFGEPTLQPGDGTTWEALPTFDAAAKFEVGLYVAASPGGLRVEAVGAASHFDTADLEELLGQYTTLLERALDAPAERLDAHPLLTAAAAAALPRPHEPLPRLPWCGPVTGAVARHAAADPRRLAVADPDERWTYGDLDAGTNRLARLLRARGVRRGDRVAILAERRACLTAAILAVQRTGALFCVVDAAHPEAVLRERLRLLRPRALLRTGAAPVPPGARDDLRGAGVAVVEPLVTRADWAAVLHEQAAAPLDHEPAFDDPACVVFTSGSTGAPLAVVGRHGGLTAFLPWQQEAWSLGATDRFAMLSALDHDPLQRDVLTPLHVGASLVVPDAERFAEPGYLARWLAAERVTVANLTPATGRLLHAGAGDAATVESLRLAFFVGETLTHGDVRALRRRCPGVRAVNLYGTTETQRALSWQQVDGGADLPDATPVPLGGGMPWMQVLVLAEAGGLAGVGEIGEIVIRSPALALGYLDPGDPARTLATPPGEPRARFAVNPLRDDPEDRVYRTGDLGRYEPGGTVAFVGRADRQVQVRGYRVEPEVVERALLGAAGVREAAVVALPGAEGSTLVGFVAPERGLAPAEVVQALRRGLPASHVPARVVALDRLPRLPGGKVDLGELRRLGALAPAGGEVGQRPATATEQRLQALWSAALDLDDVGLDDDFFGLGGHSLLAARLLHEVGAEFGVTVPLRRLVEAPTLAAMAREIDLLRAGEDSEGHLPVVTPDPAARHEPFPLTDMQWAYWVGRSAGIPGDGVASHVYWEFDSPDLDVGRLERAWRRLVERHGMLRAVVLPDGRQQVLAEVPAYEITRHDLRDLPAEEAGPARETIRSRMSHLVRSGAEWPLFDLEASRDAAGWRVHFSMDFLVADASCWGVLAPELRRLYEDPEAPLPELELTFRDYVVAASALPSTEPARKSEAYWQARVATLPGPPGLPRRGDGDAAGGSRFVRHAAALEAGGWQDVTREAARRGLTPVSALLAAYCEVLARWSDGPHFLLGVPLFNRLPLHPEVGAVVGDFTSLTPLEVSWTGGTLADRARAVQRRLWEDLDHRWTSGVQVLRAAARHRGGGVVAATPVVFTSKLGLGDLAASTPELEMLGTPRFGITQTPQVWLDHQVSQDAITGALRFNWDVVEDRFPPGTVEAMFGAYRDLLGRLRSAGAWDEATHDLVPAEQRTRRRRVNATGGALPRGLLHDPVLEQAAARPGAAAVVAPDRTLSYAQLLETSGRAAAWLSREGAVANRPVAVVTERGWQEVAAVLAVLRAGAAYLPVPAALPELRIRQLLDRGEVECVLTQAAVDGRLDWPGGIRRLVVDRADGLPADSGVPTPTTRSGDLAYVIFTSGSTGEPKGVMIDHRGARNTVDDINERFSVGPGDRVLALSSLGFDLSVYDLFGLLGAGGGVVLPPEHGRRDPAVWQHLLDREQVTIWNTVPALMQLLVEHLEHRGERFPASLRLVLLSGDWIPVDLPDRVRALARDGVRVVSLGGATEASIWSIAYEIGEVDPGWASIPYGTPLRNQRFHVLDGAGGARPDWVAGELAIAGTGLAHGYWRDPDQTGDRFVHSDQLAERLYLTGDLGRYLPSGDIELLGRRDGQVKIRGHRIELGEVEAALRRAERVDTAVVVARGPRDGQRLVAYVVPAGGEDGELEAALRAHLRTLLPEYMVPSAFMLLDRLPLTANGKVDRAALPEPRRAVSADRDPPATEHERLVAEVFAATLALETVGRGDNFFEHGGSSVEVIAAQRALSERAGVEVPVAALFERATPRDLGVYLEQLTATAARAPGPAQRAGPAQERARRRKAALRARRGR